MAGTILKALSFEQPSTAILRQLASIQHGRLTLLLGLHKGTLQQGVILVKCTRQTLKDDLKRLKKNPPKPSQSSLVPRNRAIILSCLLEKVIFRHSCAHRKL